MTTETRGPVAPEVRDAPSGGSDRHGATTVAITPRLLLTAIVPVVVVLNVLNAIAVFLYHRNGEGQFFSTFSFDEEANVPSWFASTLLLLAASVVALVAADAVWHGKPWRRHWTGLALVFVALSLGETAQIHERIGSRLRGYLDLSGPLYYAGVIPMLALALLVAIAYFRFLLALPRVTRVGIVVAAAIYVGAAAIVEALTGWWKDTHESASTALLVVATFEENLETLGITVFILTVLAYFAALGRPVALSAPRAGSASSA